MIHTLLIYILYNRVNILILILIVFREIKLLDSFREQEKQE
jgi:hypothetical protein